MSIKLRSNLLSPHLTTDNGVLHQHLIASEQQSRVYAVANTDRCSGGKIGRLVLQCKNRLRKPTTSIHVTIMIREKEEIEINLVISTKTAVSWIHLNINLALLGKKILLQKGRFIGAKNIVKIEHHWRR